MTDHEMRIRLRQDWAQARTWAARWKAVAHRHRSHARGLTMRWVTNLTGRVRAEMEVARLEASLDSANACANRIQADGNALADQLHAWRQACQDHGIEATPDALRAVLRRVDAGCVAEAPRCLDCGRSAEQVDGRWRPRCWCVGFADELAGADL